MLVDSHAHLGSPEFKDDCDKVISDSGLDYILNVSTDEKSIVFSAELAKRHDNVYYTCGIHPHYAGKADINVFRQHYNDPKLKAIGETGLDFYRNLSSKTVQEKLFRESLKEAEGNSLPVIVHQRNAEEEIIRIIKEYKVNGVMHCFSGDYSYAKKCLDLGFYISFAGNITYPKAHDLRDTAKKIPLDKLLIETDSPWLAPQPVRGKRNEPKYVVYTAQEIAGIKSVKTEEIGERTAENFKVLFKI